MISFRTQSQSGFTLVEMLFYIALLTLVSSASILLLFSLDDLFAKYRAEQLVYRSGTNVLERMLYDIRDAEMVTSASYTHPPSLKLEGGSATIEYATSSNALHVSEDGVDLGPLTDERVQVDAIRFYAYSDTTEFVRVAMTLSATVGESTVTKTFNAGAVLRGSYEE